MSNSWANEVECTACGAPVGQVCRTKTKGVPCLPHASRIRAYNKVHGKWYRDLYPGRC
jgi:hypothetical protein